MFDVSFIPPFLPWPSSILQMLTTVVVLYAAKMIKTVQFQDFDRSIFLKVSTLVALWCHALPRCSIYLFNDLTVPFMPRFSPCLCCMLGTISLDWPAPRSSGFSLCSMWWSSCRLAPCVWLCSCLLQPAHVHRVEEVHHRDDHDLGGVRFTVSYVWSHSSSCGLERLFDSILMSYSPGKDFLNAWFIVWVPSSSVPWLLRGMAFLIFFFSILWSVCRTRGEGLS